MESNNGLETKYQKLAAEYSKLRAQASVLKKAVLEEQTKTSNLRDTLRQKESSLRRCEQEVDSLGFRNKQLEHRVAALQEDFEKELKKSHNVGKHLKILKTNSKTNSSNDLTISSTTPQHSSVQNLINDPLIFDELHKKIIENAKLTTQIDDKERENLLYFERIKEIEKQLQKHITDSNELEKRLRRDLDISIARNSELETKLVEVPSIIGSEDNLSVSESDITTPIHTHTTNSSSSDQDRIASLQREVAHWRTQCEILKITDLSLINHSFKEKNNLNGALTKHSHHRNNSSTVDKNLPNEIENDESISKDLIFQYFSKKIEELFKSKLNAESKLSSYILECENLRTYLDNSIKELKSREFELKQSERNLNTVEEDLATTRINYEEQISVLTEQVINLSDQLASCK